HQWDVAVRAPIFQMTHVAFALQNADRGENRVVGQRRLLGQAGEQLLHRRRAPLPEHLHQAQLSFRQCWRGSPRQDISQPAVPATILRRANRKKVTNLLVGASCVASVTSRAAEILSEAKDRNSKSRRSLFGYF